MSRLKEGQLYEAFTEYVDDQYGGYEESTGIVMYLYTDYSDNDYKWYDAYVVLNSEGFVEYLSCSDHELRDIIRNTK